MRAAALLRLQSAYEGGVSGTASAGSVVDRQQELSRSLTGTLLARLPCFTVRTNAQQLGVALDVDPGDVYVRVRASIVRAYGTRRVLVPSRAPTRHCTTASAVGVGFVYRTYISSSTTSTDYMDYLPYLVPKATKKGPNCRSRRLSA